MIWFTADTHFSHKNVIKYCNRPFDSINDMNDCLIYNWNSLVSPGDIVYHLGDFGNDRDPAIVSVFNKLKGNKILIQGNHDHSAIRNLNWGWVKQVYYLKEHKLWLSHFPHVYWHFSYYGSRHLFGHEHGKFDGIGKSIDVGVDTNDYKPYSINEVNELLKVKEPYGKQVG